MRQLDDISLRQCRLGSLGCLDVLLGLRTLRVSASRFLLKRPCKQQGLGTGMQPRMRILSVPTPAVDLSVVMETTSAGHLLPAGGCCSQVFIQQCQIKDWGLSLSTLSRV